MAIKLWLDYTVRAMDPVKKDVHQKIGAQLSLIERLTKTVAVELGFTTDILTIGSVATETNVATGDCSDLLVLLLPGNENANIDESEIIESLIHFKCMIHNQIISKFPETKFSEPHHYSINLTNQNVPFCINIFFGYRLHLKDNNPGTYKLSDNIKLLNFRSRSLIVANPLQNIMQLNHKDNLVNRNVKPLIRILKTIKNNAINPIELTGYEISSIVYSMDNYLLDKPNGQLLFLLLECSLFLKHIEDNEFLRLNLKSPGNELFLNEVNDTRFQKGVHFLKIELDFLIRNLVLEIDLYTNIYEHATKI